MGAETGAGERLLLLHGHASSPPAMAPVADALARRLGLAVLVPRGPFAVREPDGPDGVSEGYAWWPDDADGPDAATVAAVRDWVGAGVSIVVGFSQGGAMALALGTADHVACVGGFLAGAAPEGSRTVLFVHGRADAVVDLDHAELAARRCRRQGCKVTEVYHDGGHEWTDAVTDALVAWAQGRSAG